MLLVDKIRFSLSASEGQVRFNPCDAVSYRIEFVSLAAEDVPLELAPLPLQ